MFFGVFYIFIFTYFYLKGFLQDFAKCIASQNILDLSFLSLK